MVWLLLRRGRAGAMGWGSHEWLGCYSINKAWQYTAVSADSRVAGLTGVVEQRFNHDEQRPIRDDRPLIVCSRSVVVAPSRPVRRSGATPCPETERYGDAVYLFRSTVVLTNWNVVCLFYVRLCVPGGSKIHSVKQYQIVNYQIKCEAWKRKSTEVVQQ